MRMSRIPPLALFLGHLAGFALYGGLVQGAWGEGLLRGTVVGGIAAGLSWLIRRKLSEPRESS